MNYKNQTFFTIFDYAFVCLLPVAFWSFCLCCDCSNILLKWYKIPYQKLFKVQENSSTIININYYKIII